MNIDVQIKGVSKAIRALKDASKEVQAKVDDELFESAKLIESRAKKNVKVNSGRLRSSINAQKISTMQYEVLVNANYAPYVEFGTKSKVRVPSGLEGYAMQFKGGGGDFDTLVDNIEVWAKQKGIPQEAVYPIAITIAREGVRAQPFLFPAFEAERPRLIKRLRKHVGK